MMESAANKNCGHCNNPGAVKKCCKSHTRCKEVRFCNKHCEKNAHVKKPTEEQPETPSSDAENLLKQEIDAEMKKDAKKERQTKKMVQLADFEQFGTRNSEQWKFLEDQKKKK